MNIVTATKAYEKWLGRCMGLIKEDLRLKHKRMEDSPFLFLRATFYRWMQHWDDNFEEFGDCPRVLAVGDLHIENFGTWRDIDGRLIWGVNDFDEAFQLPYAIDLIRLAASARLAVKERNFSIDSEDATAAILDGYEEGLKKPEPFVLEERHRWLREIAYGELREPAPFWKKMEKLKVAKGKEFASAKRVLQSEMPTPGMKLKFYRRVAGMGSLGRPRIVALADWGGGYTCREAKHVAPSAVLWARNLPYRSQHTQDILDRAVRVKDPFYQVKGKWLVRRLAPHCSKIEIGHLSKRGDEARMLSAMGKETANIHLGSLKPSKILRDFTKKRQRQIERSVERMADLTIKDWKHWRKR